MEERLQDKIKELSQVQEANKTQDDKVHPLWFYKDDNGKKVVGVLGLSKEILSENYMVTFDSFKSGYRYDEKLGHWRIGYKEYLGKVISDKLQSVGFWKPNSFNSTQLFISNQIYSDTSINFFDHSDPNLVVFKNGTYNFKEDILKSNDPNDYILTGHDYNLDMKSDTPITDAWFRETFQDADKFMMEYIGYMFYRSYKPFQKFVILRGSGGDGKSTFLNYVRKMIGGSNTSSVDLKGLSGDNAKFNTSHLYGKELNYFADIGKNYLEDSSTIKALTGDDYITGEFKGKDPFDFMNYAKLLFSANELPTFSDFTKGFIRRIGLVNFYFIPDFTNRYDMKQIEDEIPAFTYKCMLAFEKAHKSKKLSETPEMINQTNKWLEMNNHIATFVSDMCIINLDNEQGESSSCVYKEYKDYCSNQGYNPRGQSALTEYLETKGIVHKKKQIKGDRVWRYIHLAMNDKKGVNF